MAGCEIPEALRSLEHLHDLVAHMETGASTDHPVVLHEHIDRDQSGLGLVGHVEKYQGFTRLVGDNQLERALGNHLHALFFPTLVEVTQNLVAVRIFVDVLFLALRLPAGVRRLVPRHAHRVDRVEAVKSRLEFGRHVLVEHGSAPYGYSYAGDGMNGTSIRVQM